MSQEALKQKAAKKALDWVSRGMVVGVGTGSTVNYFIDALAAADLKIEGAVASSKATADRLKRHHIPVLDLNTTGDLDLYIDGADEANEHFQLIKGGGGALTGEKIVASVSKKFICIIDASKKVEVLGRNFPLPIEVIPLARSAVGRAMFRVGGQPIYRQGFVSDYGNYILDIHNLSILDPVKLETELNQLPGLVTNGIFAIRKADVLIIGGENKVEVLVGE